MSRKNSLRRGEACIHSLDGGELEVELEAAWIRSHSPTPCSSLHETEDANISLPVFVREQEVLADRHNCSKELCMHSVELCEHSRDNAKSSVH